MPKRLGSAEIVRILEEHGFHFVTQRGSHVKMRHANGHTAIIPHPTARGSDWHHPFDHPPIRPHSRRLRILTPGSPVDSADIRPRIHANFRNENPGH